MTRECLQGTLTEPMNKDNELAARRQAAIDDDKCFTKGRLRDEFRMKPVPDAEPVKWYKSQFGGKYAVYRIADCVPMREKLPLTVKQQQAGARLAIQAKLRSQCGRLAACAHNWMSQDVLFLDTETTGLDGAAQVIEIGLVDVNGHVIFETRLKPTVSMAPEAAAVHGISEAELATFPVWPDIALQLQQAIGQRLVVIFNEEFDIRLLKQTAAAYSDPADWLTAVKTCCAMKLAAGYFGATNRYGTISLANAANLAGLEWASQAHSAVADAQMTARVVGVIADYYCQLQREITTQAGGVASNMKPQKRDTSR